MSFKMSAIIMSIPLDSWVAMQVCKRREGSWGIGQTERRVGEKKVRGQAEGARERTCTSEISRKRTQNLKDLVTVKNLPV